MEKKASQASHEEEEQEGEEEYTYLTVEDGAIEGGEEVIYTLDDGEEEQDESHSEDKLEPRNEKGNSDGTKDFGEDHIVDLDKPGDHQQKPIAIIRNEGSHEAKEAKNV